MLNRRNLFKGFLAGAILGSTAATAIAKAVTTQPAFDRLNKRAVIIRLQKSMEEAMGHGMFEVNDELTRMNVREYIRVTADKFKKNGNLYDYQLVLDETNNTPKVIDNCELHCDIYLKFPNETTFTHLNALASRKGITSEEVIGSLG